jgi:hypothetical protein
VAALARHGNVCSRAPRTDRRSGVRKDGWVFDREAQGSLPVGVRPGEMPGSPVVRPPCVVERRGAKRGGSTGRSVASSEACGVVNVRRLLGRSRRSRARVNGAKAMERTWGPGAGAEEPPGVWGVERSEGCAGNWGDPPRPGPCGGSEQHRSISGDPVKWPVAERESEGVVVVVMAGTTQPGSERRAPASSMHDVCWEGR